MVEIDLAGHTALVTGASGGIGGAIAPRLAEAGAAAVVHYRRMRGRRTHMRADLEIGRMCSPRPCRPNRARSALRHLSKRIVWEQRTPPEQTRAPPPPRRK